MSNDIKLITGSLEFLISLNNTKTSLKILEALPFESTINRWGDEIYFKIPVYSELENGVEILDLGSVAYWPPGSSLCIFFGKTPISTGDKPQAASPVTIIGEIKDKEILCKLKKITDGEKIEIKAAKQT
jgi:hypothetical protein